MQQQLIRRTVGQTLPVVEELAVIINHPTDLRVGLEEIRIRRDAKTVEKVDFNRDDDLLRGFKTRNRAFVATPQVCWCDWTATCIHARLIGDIPIRLVSG